MVQCKSKFTDEGDSKEQLKISLAEWSIHRSVTDGTYRAEDFAAIAKNDFGITAVEYVASLYKDHALDEAYWKKLKSTSDSLGVKNLIMMVDNEGDLGSPDPAERKKAVENHFKWVKAASILDCHSIRVNAFGDGSKEDVKQAMVDALKQLCGYAAEYKMNVLIENHGLYSADGQWVAEIMKEVNLPNCGTLPDFGNWCTAVKWGSTEASKNCTAAYDRYKGVSEFLPFARGVSAKSYQFNDEGEETVIDYSKMLKLVNESGFKGFIGIEYEGSTLSEKDGILATKSLLEKTWQKLNP